MRSDSSSITAVPKPWAQESTFERNGFGAIRLFLALMVLLSHSFPLALGVESSNSTGLLFGERLGNSAVNCFFAISGFLVSRSWERSEGGRQYLMKRFVRIYPSFVVLIALQFFVFVPLILGDQFPGYSPRDFFSVVLGMLNLTSSGLPPGHFPKLFPGNPYPGELNASLWTIRYEFICYLLLPLVGRGRWRVWIWGGVCCFALMLYLSELVSSTPPIVSMLIGDIRPWPRLLSWFSGGVLFYEYRRWIPHSHALALAALFTILLFQFLWRSAVDGALLICGIYLLFYIAYLRFLQRFSFGQLGDPSYGIYLYGFPLQQLIVTIWSPIGAGDPYLLVLVSAPLAILVGLANRYLLERRMLRRPMFTKSSFKSQ